MALIKPNLNKPAFMLFPEKADLIRQGKCAFCKKEIKQSEFKDNLSKKEYSISGLCFSCQKEIFGSEN